MPSPCIYDWTGTWADSEKWTGHITKIEATGTPKNALLGGDDCATGMMGRALRESFQIAKTFSAKFIKIIDPRNQFFLNNW